jgi:gluconolactonase
MAEPGFERIVPSESVLEEIVDDNIFTEGPVWDPAIGGLYWTDIRGNRIYKWTPTTGEEVVMDQCGLPDGMTLDLEGRLVIAGWASRTVWRLEPTGHVTVLASHYEGKKLNTPNDIVVKSDGSIYWTDPNGGMYNVGMCDQDVQKYLDIQPIFRLSPDGRELKALVDDFMNPNGLCFSPDESLLYINDTPRRHIRVFDVLADGSLTNGRLFADLQGTEEGNPDGLKVDVEGNVYCTGPAGIHVWEPSGRFQGRFHVPQSVANMGWGDDDWKTMYITARSSVYRVRLGIAGVPHGETYRRQALAAAGKL